MSNALYQLYLQRVFRLAKTLVVKSELTADAINNSLTELGYPVDLNYPETWKYYLNLAGELHPTDSPMEIVSLDTLENIEFTKANLQEHRATAREYRYGSRYYQELVRRFPKQEMLILGILNPVEKTRAIEAQDGTILYHDGDLVESNEHSLIPRLQEWIYGYLARWHVRDYALVDDLYGPSMLGVMFSMIPQVILNIRLSHCKTNEAHSYHIREYLASHGGLDEYITALTKKQALFLYRNILYIQRNAGKQETLDLLIERIMTERNLPVSAYDLRHNLANQPENIYPDIELLQEPINLERLGGRSDIYTVETILAKEFPLAKDNVNNAEQAEARITEEMRTAKYSRVPTKILESNVIDLSEQTPYRFEDVLLNQWIYWSTHDRYQAVISVTDPVSGDVHRITVRDAFVLYLYCFNKVNGLTLAEVPRVEALDVRRVPLPGFTALRGLCHPQYVPDEMITLAIQDLTPIGVYISTESFYETCESIHDDMQFHRLLYVQQESFLARGEVWGMVGHLYADVPCELSEEVTYDEWFANRGLDFTALSAFDFDIVAREISSKATGADLNNTRSVEELQNAMVRLMEKLSSYSVQYLRNVNSSPYRILDWGVIRPGEMDSQSHSRERIPFDNSRIVDTSARIRPEVYVGTFPAEEDITPKVRALSELEVEATLTMESMGTTTYPMRINTAAVGIARIREFGNYLSDYLRNGILDGLEADRMGAAIDVFIWNRMLDGIHVRPLAPFLSQHILQTKLSGLDMAALQSRLDMNLRTLQLDGLEGFVEKTPLANILTEGPLNAHWVVTPDNITTDVAIGAERMLITAMNQRSNRPLLLDYVYFGEFVPGAYDREIGVVVHSRIQSPYTGETVVYYNRVDITPFFENGEFTVTTNADYTPSNIVRRINEEGGLSISINDVRIRELAPRRFEVRIGEQSLAWKGSIVVNWEAAFDLSPVSNNMQRLGDSDYWRMEERVSVSRGPASRGLSPTPFSQHTWEAKVSNQTIILRDPEGSEEALFNAGEELDQISLTFDQSGRPMVAYETDGRIKLWWYDPDLNAVTVADLDEGTSPFIGIDDFTNTDNTNTIVLAYVRDNRVVYRKQQDRYRTLYQTNVENAIALLNMSESIQGGLVIHYAVDLGENGVGVRNIATERSGLWNFERIETEASALTAMRLELGVERVEPGMEPVEQATATSGFSELRISDGTFRHNQPDTLTTSIQRQITNLSFDLTLDLVRRPEGGDVESYPIINRTVSGFEMELRDRKINQVSADQVEAPEITRAATSPVFVLNRDVKVTKEIGGTDTSPSISRTITNASFTLN